MYLARLLSFVEVSEIEIFDDGILVVLHSSA